MHRYNLLFWVAALTSLVLDRLTKIWVTQNFVLKETWPLLSGLLHFTYTENPGAAFGIFAHADWLRWLSLIACIGCLGIGLFNSRLSRWEQAGYGFLLGGAAGNGIDRWLTGYVVDFLDFRLFGVPVFVFNVADTAINIGLACLLFAAWRRGPRKHNTPS